MKAVRMYCLFPKQVQLILITFNVIFFTYQFVQMLLLLLVVFSSSAISADTVTRSISSEKTVEKRRYLKGPGGKESKETKAPKATKSPKKTKAPKKTKSPKKATKSPKKTKAPGGPGPKGKKMRQ